jgi:hypothetical protein
LPVEAISWLVYNISIWLIISVHSSVSNLCDHSEAIMKIDSSSTITFQRELSVRYDVDVFVAGGGPAGVAAAVMAARQGRSVYLAEAHSCFGGMGTAALVPCFMPFTDGIHFLAGGMGEEIYHRLKACSPQIYWDDPNGVVGIQPEALKRAYDGLIQEAKVDFTFYTQLIGLEMEGGWVRHAVCSAKSGLFAVRAKIFIDATGDGDLAAWAGAPYEKGDARGAMMPGTLCSLWSGVDWEHLQPSQDEALLEKAIADGVFTIPDHHLPGMFRVGREQAGGNLVHTFGVDGTDERSLTRALVDGRQRLLEYQAFYQKYYPGYEEMELAATGSLLGIRESRRIMGDTMLCLDDFERRAVFEDEIGRYNYAVDVHASAPDSVQFRQFEEDFKRLRYGPGESYGIPYRVLTPRGLENVLVAGRCVSTDRYLQGSLRVMPGCYITGQAAGMAATLAVEKDTGTRGIEVGELQARLKRVGAYLPNA